MLTDTFYDKELDSILKDAIAEHIAEMSSITNRRVEELNEEHHLPVNVQISYVISVQLTLLFQTCLSVHHGDPYRAKEMLAEIADDMKNFTPPIQRN